jgi:ribosome-associated protein
LPHPPELTTIVRALDDKRAKNIVVLDLTTASETLSYFIVATGESLLQLRAMEDEVRHTLKDEGILPRGVEGPSERWVLMDYGDTVVHLMSPDAREFYDLEGLWADAAPLELLVDASS